MTSRPSEQILSEVSGRLVQMGDPGSDRYFLYLETEDGVQSPSLFQEFEDRAQDMASSAVGALLYELWLGAEPEHWGALRLDVKGNKFTAYFDYDVDPADGQTDERAQAAIKARFGVKPIVYLSHEEWFEQHSLQSDMFDS